MIFHKPRFFRIHRTRQPSTIHNPPSVYTTRFLTQAEPLIFKQIELNTKNSSKRQQSCRLVEFLVFNSAFGRHRHWWIPITSYSFIIIDMSFIIYQLLESDPTWQVGSLSTESIDDMTMMMNEYDMIGINQCLCLPKAELNTKNSTKRRLTAPFGWVSGVQLGLRQMAVTE